MQSSQGGVDSMDGKGLGTSRGIWPYRRERGSRASVLCYGRYATILSIYDWVQSLEQETMKAATGGVNMLLIR